jgi:hypothetical protein
VSQPTSASKRLKTNDSSFRLPSEIDMSTSSAAEMLNISIGLDQSFAGLPPDVLDISNALNSSVDSSFVARRPPIRKGKFSKEDRAKLSAEIDWFAANGGLSREIALIQLFHPDRQPIDKALHARFMRRLRRALPDREWQAIREFFARAFRAELAESMQRFHQMAAFVASHVPPMIEVPESNLATSESSTERGDVDVDQNLTSAPPGLVRQLSAGKWNQEEIDMLRCVA